MTHIRIIADSTGQYSPAICDGDACDCACERTDYHPPDWWVVRVLPTRPTNALLPAIRQAQEIGERMRLPVVV